jgi:DNA repair protein RecN (Recombination protein N)
MQQLGMAGGRFEVALLPQSEPQAYGLETVELRVAGHAGSTPRAAGQGGLGRRTVAPGAGHRVTTAQAAGPAGAATLIFDEIDAGVGGAVADSVGRLMKQLGHTPGRGGQVLAVTHLAQVAACADHHCGGVQGPAGRQTLSASCRSVEGRSARGRGGAHAGRREAWGTAHAQAMLGSREGSA